MTRMIRRWLSPSACLATEPSVTASRTRRRNTQPAVRGASAAIWDLTLRLLVVCWCCLILSPAGRGDERRTGRLVLEEW